MCLDVRNASPAHLKRVDMNAVLLLTYGLVTVDVARDCLGPNLMAEYDFFLGTDGEPRKTSQ